MGGVAALAGNDKARQQRIVDVFDDTFGDLIGEDPLALRRKFRKMAAEPFAFYRGSAALFYADVASIEDRFADKRTSRIWIQGDLHAENYGTYMDAEGKLVFDVNDFDEAYLGHFTWDLQRMAASVALLGFAKALSDEAIERLISAYAGAYLDQVERFTELVDDDSFQLNLATSRGPVHEVLQEARAHTRVDLLQSLTSLDGQGERRFRDGPGVRRLDVEAQAKVHAAYQDYLGTIPEDKRGESLSYTVKDIVAIRGAGIGSAGLPMYSVLVEGRTEALENDVILSMKQGGVAAPSRVIDDKKLQSFFHHHGHRTALSQRALQAHADPWLGWCELDGRGQVVKELSPYEADLEWDGLTEPEEMRPLIESLGRATAKIHCVADADSDQSLVPFQTEEAIVAAVGDQHDAFLSELAEFGTAYGAMTRNDHRLFVDAFRSGRIAGVPVED